MKSDTGLSVIVFWMASIISALVVLSILGLMVMLIFPVLSHVSLFDLVLGAWAPLQGGFGIRSMIAGTLWISFLALFLSFPLSLGTSVFICFTCPGGMGQVLKKAVEFMSAIPTVIYGFVGIFLLVPLIRESFSSGSGLCILSAGIMLAVLITPTMVLFFVQSFSMIPDSHLKGAQALGATTAQQFFHVVLPGAWSGMLTGLVLSFGRAAGDTLIALMISGNSVSMPSGVLDSARTLTAHIALVIAADFDSMEFKSLFVSGICLYALTCIGVVAARYMGRQKAVDR